MCPRQSHAVNEEQHIPEGRGKTSSQGQEWPVPSPGDSFQANLVLDIPV